MPEAAVAPPVEVQEVTPPPPEAIPVTPAAETAIPDSLRGILSDSNASVDDALRAVAKGEVPTAEVSAADQAVADINDTPADSRTNLQSQVVNEMTRTGAAGVAEAVAPISPNGETPQEPTPAFLEAKKTAEAARDSAQQTAGEQPQAEAIPVQPSQTTEEQVQRAGDAQAAPPPVEAGIPEAQATEPQAQPEAAAAPAPETAPKPGVNQLSQETAEQILNALGLRSQSPEVAYDILTDQDFGLKTIEELEAKGINIPPEIKTKAEQNATELRSRQAKTARPANAEAAQPTPQSSKPEASTRTTEAPQPTAEGRPTAEAANTTHNKAETPEAKAEQRRVVERVAVAELSLQLTNQLGPEEAKAWIETAIMHPDIIPTIHKQVLKQEPPPNTAQLATRETSTNLAENADRQQQLESMGELGRALSKFKNLPAGEASKLIESVAKNPEVTDALNSVLEQIKPETAKDQLQAAATALEASVKSIGTTMTEKAKGFMQLLLDLLKMLATGLLLVGMSTAPAIAGGVMGRNR